MGYWRLGVLAACFLMGCGGPAVSDVGPGELDAGLDSRIDGGLDSPPLSDGGIDAALDVGEGDDVSTTADGGPGDASPGDAGMGDVGMGDAGMGDAGMGDAGPETRRAGFVEFIQTTAGALGSGITGGFVPVSIDDLYRGTYPGCVIDTAIGDCFVATCPVLPATDDAGTVTVTVEGTLAASMTRSSSYISFFPMVSFSEGDVVGFASSGATVPAFSGTVTAPAPLDMVFPSTVSRSADLVLSWGATVGSDVVVQITVDGTRVLCQAPASQASIGVDRSFFAAQPSGTAVDFAARVESRERVVVGLYDIDLIASEEHRGAGTLE